MTPHRYSRIIKVLDKRQPDLTVITERVHKPHNVSAIIRTCDAVGIIKAHIVMPDDKKFRARSGIAMGSDRWVDHDMYTDISAPIDALKQSSHKVYAAHLSDQAIDFRSVDYTQPTAILFGTEKFGVSDEAIERCDGHIVIPMLGMVESYNVSVAAAIILSEAQRQRMVAGMYDQQRLSDELYQHYLFRWGHPQVAKFCKQKGIDYPPLDEKGDIVGGGKWIARMRDDGLG